MVSSCECDRISVTHSGVLYGLHHHCPLCDLILKYNPMPDAGETYWYCLQCKWWGTGQLIEMMVGDIAWEE